MRISACEPAAIAAPSPTATRSSSPLTICWPGIVIGLPGRISWSLAKAMFEPQKETDPTMAAKREKTAT